MICSYEADRIPDPPLQVHSRFRLDRGITVDGYGWEERVGKDNRLEGASQVQSVRPGALRSGPRVAAQPAQRPDRKPGGVFDAIRPIGRRVRGDPDADRGEVAALRADRDARL